MVARNRRRGQVFEAMTGTALGAIALVAVWFGAKPLVFGTAPVTHITAAAAASPASASYGPSYPASAAAPVSSKRPDQIPVLTYHQLNNGCAPSAAMCGRTGDARVILSTAQFYAQLNYLHEQGYHTITAPAYVKWAAHQPVLLPYKPILLTVDDGISNFVTAATPVLRHFGYSMVDMIVSGFASGAQDGQRPYAGWDASWSDLRQLDPSVWNFAFHAGPRGHLNFASKSCPYFYPCQRPGETAAAYRARVQADVNAGVSELRRELPNADTQMWGVPWNDLAQAPNEPQSGTETVKWLNSYATHRFTVVFVDGFRPAVNEHYRFEVHGTDSLHSFIAQLNSTLADGSFADTSGNDSTASSVLERPPVPAPTVGDDQCGHCRQQRDQDRPGQDRDEAEATGGGVGSGRRGGSRAAREGDLRPEGLVVQPAVQRDRGVPGAVDHLPGQHEPDWFGLPACQGGTQLSRIGAGRSGCSR